MKKSHKFLKVQKLVIYEYLIVISNKKQYNDYLN